MFISSMWDVKEPTLSSRRVGHEVPGVVVGWEGATVIGTKLLWCSVSLTAKVK